ncbi:MFS transporter [Streptomyces sp. SID14478]|uniref:MFS transporter n=1 Tax=Streptomyces sp. SID14478 TaxID=2706073 RepID=UPI0013DE7B0F|nr:MFS transporter [Streptomyces sp. SID14478]NEB80138.1 MFS transporter [Streptomyces sp. SID14478]
MGTGRVSGTGRAGTGRGMLGAMAVVIVFSGVVQGYLTPLLPELGRRLGIDGVGQNNLYLLSQCAFAVLTPLLSRLGDLYGHRRLLRLALTMVAAGSLLMAVWPTAATLTVGVVLQGALVGFFPLLAGILRSRAPERGRGGISLLVGALLIAIGVGGLVAGALSERHAVAGLWAAVPVALLALVAGLVLPDSDGPRGGRFHFGAAALLTAGLVALVLVLAQGGAWGWASVRSLGTALLAAVVLGAWVAVELRARHPLVNVRMLRDRRLAVVSAHTFCAAFGTIGFLGANALFLGADPAVTGYGMDLGPQSIATVSLAMVVAGFAGSTATPRLARRIGDRAVLAAGGVLVALGFLGMTLFHGTLPQYVASALVVGLATGLFESITRTLSAEVVPERQTALAVGLNELALSLGAAIGAAVIGGLFAAHRLGGAGGHIALAGYQWSWGVCCGVALVGAAVGLGYGDLRSADPRPAVGVRPLSPRRPSDSPTSPNSPKEGLV